jgi:hypothetical protein
MKIARRLSVYRNPFDDELLASGSDDGKVQRAMTMMSGSRLNLCHRSFFGGSRRSSHSSRMPKSLKIYYRLGNCLVTLGKLSLFEKPTRGLTTPVEKLAMFSSTLLLKTSLRALRAILRLNSGISRKAKTASF